LTGVLGESLDGLQGFLHLPQR